MIVPFIAINHLCIRNSKTLFTMETQHLILSQDQVQQYKKDGYILYKDQLFGTEKFNKLFQIFEEHLQNKGEKRSDELDTPHFRDERLFEFLMADEVLDMVEQVIGPNIGLWSSHFISKEPHSGRRTPWHEDSGYWKGRFDRLDKIVTVWLALDPSNLQNGCMGVVPGTHLLDDSSEYIELGNESASFPSEIKGGIDESKVVWFELEPGECSLHDGRIVHGAHANNSPQRRTGYTMRYFDLGMKYDKDNKQNAGHKLYYCRGNNTGNNPLITP